MECTHPVLYEINGRTVCHICGADLTPVAEPAAEPAPAPAKQEKPKKKSS